MKIQEAEALAGISKKSIRFYEEQGLLTPRRNSENGYREYGLPEVECLRRIKLLRKLGLSLEEIRRILAGRQSLQEGMRRHLALLEEEKKNLEISIGFCRYLRDREAGLGELNAEALLQDMDERERAGARFPDRQRSDTRRRRYTGSLAAGALVVILMGAFLALLVWGYRTDPQGELPLPLFLGIAAVPVVVILGVALALGQRIQEIGRGEEDDAGKY